MTRGVCPASTVAVEMRLAKWWCRWGTLAPACLALMSLGIALMNGPRFRLGGVCTETAHDFCGGKVAWPGRGCLPRNPRRPSWQARMFQKMALELSSGSP